MPTGCHARTRRRVHCISHPQRFILAADPGAAEGDSRTTNVTRHTKLTISQDYQVLYPQDYISVNQANGTLSGREPESDTSGDDGALPIRLPRLSNDGAEARALSLVPEEARGASLPKVGQAFCPKNGRRSGELMGKVLSSSEECIGPFRETCDTETGGIYRIGSSPIKDKLSIEPTTPRRHQVEDERGNAYEGWGRANTDSPILSRETYRHDGLSGASIDPALLCTPRNQDRKVVPSTGTSSSDRSHGVRLPICRDRSVSPSPRRRRAGVWRTYKAKVDSL